MAPENPQRRLSERKGLSAAQGICYRTGPFLVRLATDYPPLLQTLAELYPGTQVRGDDEIIDFHLGLRRPLSPRRWWRPYIRFHLENLVPFEPYPLDHAFPLLEWGLNWCIATSAHQYLMLHAAVVERDGSALILPALPGSGKSTLCAALALRGWRLLSDEFGLVEPAAGRVSPLPRAVPLKNESISVIRELAPNARLGPLYPETRKGTVAHLSPPGDSLRRQLDPATPRWIVFPRFVKGRPVQLTPVPKSVAFRRLARNAFNYRLLGATGFLGATRLIRGCSSHRIEYGDLDQAIRTLEQALLE